MYRVSRNNVQYLNTKNPTHAHEIKWKRQSFGMSWILITFFTHRVINPWVSLPRQSRKCQNAVKFYNPTEKNHHGKWGVSLTSRWLSVLVEATDISGPQVNSGK